MTGQAQTDRPTCCINSTLKIQNLIPTDAVRLRLAKLCALLGLTKTERSWFHSTETPERARTGHGTETMVLFNLNFNDLAYEM
jgi:hypothetical protein